MRRSSLLFTVALALLVGLAGTFLAAEPPKTKPAKQRALPAFTPEREAIALKFVEQHHAELTMVLARLKSTHHDEYQQAIRELFQTTEMLAMSQDENHRALMLEAWKVNSRCELLAARLSQVTDADVKRKMEGDLRDMLYKYMDLQKAMAQNRREATLASLKMIEANIKRFEEDRDKLVDSRFRFLTKVRKNPVGEKKAEPSNE